MTIIISILIIVFILSKIIVSALDGTEPRNFDLDSEDAEQQ